MINNPNDFQGYWPGATRPISRIVVTCHGGKSLKDMDTFTKMDPYVVVEVPNERKTSQVHTSGGRNPVWEYSCDFEYKGQQDLLFVVWDKDPVNDDRIGSAKVSLAAMLAENNRMFTGFVPISENGEPRGEISVTIHLESC